MTTNLERLEGDNEGNCDYIKINHPLPVIKYP